MTQTLSLKRLEHIATTIILVLINIAITFPTIAIILTSFKSREHVITSPPTLVPSMWSLDGYQQVFQSDMLASYLPNTIVNALVSSIITVILAAPAGYVFARYTFRGSRLLQLAIIGVMMIPGLTNLIPLYRLASNFSLLNSNTIMILYHTSGGLPFSIWIAKGFFDHIPRELEEAALIDGATPTEVLVHILLPLALPGIFAVFLFNLVEAWNELMAAIVFLHTTASKTATVGLLDFQSQFEVAYHVQAAACVVIALPMVVVFIVCHRLFFRGIGTLV